MSKTLDEIALDAIRPVMDRLAAEMAVRVSRMAAKELRRALRASPQKKAPTRRKASAKPLTRWVPNQRARRVPKFVSKQTGLKTKQQVVTKFGEAAVFQAGRPLPKSIK